MAFLVVALALPSRSIVGPDAVLVAGSGLIIRLRKDTVGSNPTRPTNPRKASPISHHRPRNRGVGFSARNRILPSSLLPDPGDSVSQAIGDQVRIALRRCRRFVAEHPADRKQSMPALIISDAAPWRRSWNFVPECRAASRAVIHSVSNFFTPIVKCAPGAIAPPRASG